MECSKNYSNRTFIQFLNRVRIFDHASCFQLKKTEICENIGGRLSAKQIIPKNEEIEDLYWILQKNIPEKGEKFWKVCRNALVQELGIFVYLCKKKNIDPETWWLAHQYEIPKNHINQILYCFSKARCCLERQILGMEEKKIVMCNTNVFNQKKTFHDNSPLNNPNQIEFF